MTEYDFRCTFRNAVVVSVAGHTHKKVLTNLEDLDRNSSYCYCWKGFFCVNGNRLRNLMETLLYVGNRKNKKCYFLCPFFVRRISHENFSPLLLLLLLHPNQPASENKSA